MLTYSYVALFRPYLTLSLLYQIRCYFVLILETVCVFDTLLDFHLAQAILQLTVNKFRSTWYLSGIIPF